jgi:sugar lactone lactonase YvrE
MQKPTRNLYVAPGNGPQHKLFAVGHGARESIEVFNVDTRGATPVLTWIGCAIAPDPIGLNSVRGLPDGGFLTTNFLPRNQPMGSLMGGGRNGELWEWSTAGGWQKVPGSEASGANGVELSADGKTIYVAAWGSQSVFRLSRGVNPPVRTEVNLGFRIDNIHWAKDGTLLTAGQVGQDWQVAKIHPDTLKVEQIYAQKDMPGFGGGTVALEVGNTLWVGSYRGDRIAVVPLR